MAEFLKDGETVLERMLRFITDIGGALRLLEKEKERVAALTAENATLREALLWYAEKVVGLRKTTSEAKAAQQSLDTDVGQRARAALRQEGKP